MMTPEHIARDLQRVANGDRAAFERVYNATSAKLFGIVYRILRGREAAEDILQDVYVKIWQQAGRFIPERASPITWMATIARNRALDEVRRRQLDISGNDDEFMTAADPSLSPETRTEINEEYRRFERCLDELDTQRGDVVKQAYLDGFSRQELAERFGQPIGTIKTWLHRGLKQLRDCLER